MKNNFLVLYLCLGLTACSQSDSDQDKNRGSADANGIPHYKDQPLEGQIKGENFTIQWGYAQESSDGTELEFDFVDSELPPDTDPCGYYPRVDSRFVRFTLKNKVGQTSFVGKSQSFFDGAVISSTFESPPSNFLTDRALIDVQELGAMIRGRISIFFDEKTLANGNFAATFCPREKEETETPVEQ